MSKATEAAAVVPMSLLGERYIQLFPSYQGGPSLADGAIIPESRTAVPAVAPQPGTASVAAALVGATGSAGAPVAEDPSAVAAVISGARSAVGAVAEQRTPRQRCHRRR